MSASRRLRTVRPSEQLFHVTLGPFVLSLPRLFFILGVLVAFAVAALIVRGEARARAHSVLWAAVIMGALAGRVGFVVLHLDHYTSTPVEALYVWDGGLNPAVGIVTAMLTAAWLTHRRALRASMVFGPLFAGLATWGLLQLSQASTTADAPTLAELTLPNTDGLPTTLADFEGKPVVMNVWATWCPPCRREMPVLATAQGTRPDVHFVFVNQGESAATIREFLQAQRLPLKNVLLDTGSLAQQYRVAGLPTTLFFDRQGRLRQVHMGEISAPILTDYLRDMQ